MFLRYGPGTIRYPFGYELWWMNFDPYLTLQRKFNLKWIIGLNVKPETVKHLEDNIGKDLCISESQLFKDKPEKTK